MCRGSRHGSGQSVRPPFVCSSVVWPIYLSPSRREKGALCASPITLHAVQATERIVPAGHIVVQTDDVMRFFKVLDANHVRPSANDLQHGYLDAGKDAGVVIGLEALCNADWMQADVSDRFVHLIAHEYVHVQQPGARVEVEQPTLLYQTLLEGGAEYVAERISGQPANAHLQRWTQGRECALERAFLQDSMGTDLSRWLYNGPGDDARRGDLGYWIGYRIAHAYVARAPDTRNAIAELLNVQPGNAAALLKASGWQPACGAGESAQAQIQ